jgi:hypothetical protein
VAIFQRQAVKIKYKVYKTYKRFLRQDFQYSCVFCEIHENQHGGDWHFHVEHLKPKADPRFRHLTCDYDNLLYSCDHCNVYKGTEWPSDDPVSDGIGWLDPCQHDLRAHFRLGYVNDEFRLETFSMVGKWMAETLLLHTSIRFNRLKLLADEIREDLKIISILEKMVESQNSDINESIDWAGLLAARLEIMRDKFLPSQ